MIRTSRIAMVLLMTTITSCDKAEIHADPRDSAWAIKAAETCPGIRPLVRRALANGGITIADLERINGAIGMMRSSPVKGQKCDVRFDTPTTTRDVQVQDGVMMVGDVPTPTYRTIPAPE